MPRIPCTFRDQKIDIEVNKNDKISTLRSKIAKCLKKDSSKLNLYFGNEKLAENTDISELNFENGKKSAIKVILSLKPLKKQKIHVSTTEQENKFSFLKREMKFIVSNSDNIYAVEAANNILDPKTDTSISNLFLMSIKCPHICSYVFDLFKQEIAESIDIHTLTTFYNQFTDFKLAGYVFNYLSKVNENVVESFIKQLSLNAYFFKLLEYLNFDNKPSIIKRVIPKIINYKALEDAAPHIIIFLNNLTMEDKNYFTDIFVQIRDIKRSKYKNSTEVRMILLAISIKCDKYHDTLKRYDKLLNTGVKKPGLTKAVLSTIHQLYMLSMNEEPRIIDYQTIESVFDQIPINYEQSGFIHYLLTQSKENNPDIYNITNNSEITFADMLEFSYSHNFQLILKSTLVIETFLTNIFSWLSNGINFMTIFKMIHDNNPDFSSAINSLFLIYSSTGEEICTTTFSRNSKANLHHHAYYPSQLIDSIFNLLTLFIDILPKNDNVRKLDTRYIFEFSYLFLFRPNLSTQKTALKIIRKICKYKNNDDLSTFAINNEYEERKRRRSSVDSSKEKDFIYKSLMDQINDSTYFDFDESCRIIRGALLYFVKTQQTFRDDVFNLANVGGGHNLLHKLMDRIESQKLQLDQLHQNDKIKYSSEQRSYFSKELEKDTKKTKNASKSNRGSPSQPKPSSSAPVVFNSFIPQTEHNIDSQSHIKSFDDSSYSFVYLKILLDRIEKEFETYIPFLRSRLEFTSIAFSLISFGGNSSDIRESFLTFVSESKEISNLEKLDIIFRFVQNEKKLEPKQIRQSDSHLSIRKYQSMNTPLVSNSADQLIIGKTRRSRSIINKNLDFVCYEREMNIIFNILKSLKIGLLSSDEFSMKKLMYCYTSFQLALNKSLNTGFNQLINTQFKVLAKPRYIVYEYIIFYVFATFYATHNKDAAFLIQQIRPKLTTDFFKHQDNLNRKFISTILHSFLIDSEYSLKKATFIILSLKSHSRIDFSLSAFDILKENARRAIRILFTILSSQYITRKMTQEIIRYLNHFFELNYPIDSKSVSMLIGAKESVLEDLFENSKDYITRYLPLFMLNNVFSLNLWKKIASKSKEIVLQCIISTFSTYSSYLSYLLSNGENVDEFEKSPVNIKIAYQLFDIYGIKKSKPWQIITLSLLFSERNEFALNKLSKIIDDNDRLNAIKKSPIGDHFGNIFESLLNNYDKDEVNYAILEIIPLIRSKQNFNKLFSYIENEKEIDTKKVAKSIGVYCSFSRNLVAPFTLLEFLVSRINDESQLKNLTPEIKKLMSRNNKSTKEKKTKRKSNK